MLMNQLKLLFVLLSLSSILLSSSAQTNGCGSPLPHGQTPGGKSTIVTFQTLDGLNRTYLIHIPTTYNIKDKTPILFSFHGNGATSEIQESLTGFSNASVNKDAIAVYPQGYDNHWQGAPYSTKGVDDVSFVIQLIKNFTLTYCIDTTSIYASGMSNGGGFVGTLACDSTTSSLFSSFGAHSGAFYPGYNSNDCIPTSVNITCNPSRALPFLEIHGNADGTIPYHGGLHNGECLPDIPYYVTQWAIRNKLGGSNITTSIGNGNVRYEFGSQEEGTLGLVTHYMVKGLGHEWANNFNGFTSSDVMMSFFISHPL